MSLPVEDHLLKLIQLNMSLARTAFRSVTAGPSTLRYIAPRLTTLNNPLLTQSFRQAAASQSFGAGISHRWNSSQAGNKPDDDSLRIEAPTLGSKSQPIGRIEPRLYVSLPSTSLEVAVMCHRIADDRSITMTCTANDCGHRSTHEFTKRSYQKGIVIIQCPSCKERSVFPHFSIDKADGSDI
jgi:hypothetical protein